VAQPAAEQASATLRERKPEPPVKNQPFLGVAGQVARLERGQRRQQRALDVLEGELLRRAHVDQCDHVAVVGRPRLLGRPVLQPGAGDGFVIHRFLLRLSSRAGRACGRDLELRHGRRHIFSGSSL
jgi:hypothetical protein